MLRPLLLAAAIVAAGSTGVMARDYGWGYGYSRADAFQRRAAADGRITRDEWRIIRALRAQEGRRYYSRSYRRSHRPTIYFRF